MRWVLMLFVILAAVMGGEARAVVVMGRSVVSERVEEAETVERESEDALRGASREVVPEVEKATGLVDCAPLVLWFPGGSAVARSDCGAGQSGARPIEEVGLGDRVRTAEAGGAQESGTAVMDPASWRAYSLRMTRADGTVTRVDLLRPAGWEHVMAQGPDGRRTIHLELPEMGVSGEAEVLAVSPCPPVEPGVGRVVTGSFRNERNHGLRALHVSVAGEVSCLRVTSGHPVWSVTRGAWIGAGELVPGEALAAWRGEPVAVLANLPEADTATWNLEVENEHVYRVGPAGILVHNTCPTPKELFEGGGGVKGGPTHGHHSDPKFMGGDPKQKLTTMPVDQHQQLHKDLNDHLANQTDDFGNHMRPQRGNPGRAIRRNFTDVQRREAMADFYRQNETKYPDSAKDFFDQHPDRR